MEQLAPIGIFDSGYGGLTVFKEIVELMPDYDYIYLGDNARVPYGNRSFETVHEFTWECVQHLFKMNCRLVILACNTASAKALRTIQQRNLPKHYPNHKVLGVIRPTSEIIGEKSTTGNIGILATKGTVASESYIIEIKKFFPKANVYQQSCPLWVPIIEENEHQNDGADYFVKKYLDALLDQCKDIDTILLACTHYPLLIEKIRDYLPPHIKVISQGNIVAVSLDDYLRRHDEIEVTLTKQGIREYFTTDDAVDFDTKAKIFLGKGITSRHLNL
jgi:glutamate racemase